MNKTIRIGVSALAAGVVAVSGAMSVQAADMSGRAAAPVPTKKYVPAYDYDRMSQRKPAGAYSAPVVASRQSGSDWSGVYVGGSLGYDWIRSEMLDGDDTTALATKAFGIDELEAMSYGVQAGYLVTLDDSMVVGIEGDFSWMDDLDRISVKEGPEVYTFSTKLPWLASVRARIGSSLDNYMVYGTGGITFSDLEHSVKVVEAAQTITISNDKRVSGWSVGGGLEVMLAENLSTRVEYLYYDLGEHPYKFLKGASSFDSGKEVNNSLTMHAVRVGVNMRF